MRVHAWVLLLAACSDPEPARVRPEPAEGAAAEAPSGNLIAFPEGARVGEQLASSTYDAAMGLIVNYGDTLVDVHHPRPIVRARLKGMIRAWMREGRSHEGTLSAAICEATFATASLVAVQCRILGFSTRGEGAYVVESAHYRIDGDHVEPFDLAAEIADPAHIVELANAGCLEGLPEEIRNDTARRIREDVDGEAQYAREQLARLCPADEWSMALEPTGLRMDASAYDDMNIWAGITKVHVPFAQIGRVRADGPLAPLAELAGVTRAEGDRRAAPRGAQRWSVSSTSHVEELATTWLALAPADRARVALAPMPYGAARLVLVNGDRATAARIAAVLGANEERTRFAGEPLPIALVRARDALPLRPHPHIERLEDDEETGEAQWTELEVPTQILPRGTRFASIGGTIDAYPSELGREDGQVRVVASEGRTGWVDATRVEREDGCALDPAPFLARVPEADRDAVRGSLVRAFDGGALLFAGSTDDETFAAAFASSDGCTAGALLREARAPGRWLRVALPRTTEGGEPMIALSLECDGEYGPHPCQTSVFATNGSTPTWTVRHDDGGGVEWQHVELARTEFRQYCPVAIGDACLIYADGQLREAPSR